MLCALQLSQLGMAACKSLLLQGLFVLKVVAQCEHGTLPSYGQNCDQHVCRACNSVDSCIHEILLTPDDSNSGGNQHRLAQCRESLQCNDLILFFCKAFSTGPVCLPCSQGIPWRLLSDRLACLPTGEEGKLPDSLLSFADADLADPLEQLEATSTSIGGGLVSNSFFVSFC